MHHNTCCNKRRQKKKLILKSSFLIHVLCSVYNPKVYGLKSLKFCAQIRKKIFYKVFIEKQKLIMVKPISYSISSNTYFYS